MKKEIKLDNVTQWMTLYTILSNKECELEKAIQDHENGKHELFMIHETKTMLNDVKTLLDKMN